MNEWMPTSIPLCYTIRYDTIEEFNVFYMWRPMFYTLLSLYHWLMIVLLVDVGDRYSEVWDGRWVVWTWQLEGSVGRRADLCRRRWFQQTLWWVRPTLWSLLCCCVLVFPFLLCYVWTVTLLLVVHGRFDLRCCVHLCWQFSVVRFLL